MRVPRLNPRWLVVISVALFSCAPASDQSAEPMQEAAPAAAVYTPPTVPPESHELGQVDIERLMEELSNWGRWGPDDQLGAANLITPAKRLEAISLATEGITVSLAHRLLTAEAADVPQPFGHRILGVPDPSAEPTFMGGVIDTYNITYHGYSHQPPGCPVSHHVQGSDVQRCVTGDHHRGGLLQRGH